jgi:hypothetical protein
MCNIVYSNIYVRRVRAGEFIVINKHLVNELMQRNLWTINVIIIYISILKY